MKNAKKPTLIALSLHRKIMAKTIKMRFIGYVFLFLSILCYSDSNFAAGETDNPILFYTAFDASVVPQSYELNQGDVMKIKIDCKNRGNTEITPDIDFKIKQEEAVIYAAIFPYPEGQPKIQPFSTSEIGNIAIPTSSLKIGKYHAVLKISEKENFWLNKEFTFSIGKLKNQNGLSGIYSPYGNFWSVSRITSAAIILFFLFFFAEWYLNGKKSH